MFHLSKGEQGETIVEKKGWNQYLLKKLKKNTKKTKPISTYPPLISSSTDLPPPKFAWAAPSCLSSYLSFPRSRSRCASQTLATEVFFGTGCKLKKCWSAQSHTSRATGDKSYAHAEALSPNPSATEDVSGHGTGAEKLRSDFHDGVVEWKTMKKNDGKISEKNEGKKTSVNTLLQITWCK